MALTLIRSLTATILRNLASLKRDAKRLHKHSEEVFGQQYSLSVCQTAVAKARGYSGMAEVNKLASRIGLEKGAPFWSILHRTDYHEEILQAVYTLELEASDNAPLVFLGAQRDAMPVALTMFLEEMSWRKVPGLIIIETDAETVQDGMLQNAAKRLGLEDILRGFRTLDLREKNLPVSIATETRWWIDSILSVLPYETEREIQESGWGVAIENSVDAFAESRNWGKRPGGKFSPVPFYEFTQGARPIAYGNYWPNRISDQNLQFLELEIGKAPPTIAEPPKEAFMKVVRDLSERAFGLGRTVESESLIRPFVVLFSRQDPASEVLAAAIHSLFYWRFVSTRDIRPMLYLSDSTTPYAPRFLTFGTRTLVVNGLTALPAPNDSLWYGYKKAVTAVASQQCIQFMGTRIQFAQGVGESGRGVNAVESA